MGNKLPEEITDDIKTEANKIYWETHKASISRDPYCRGLTMFEVAQVPLINALTAKEVKYRELKDQAQRMADALEKCVQFKNGCYAGVYLNVLFNECEQALQQFKDGKGKERPCPHCGKELSRDRNLCCRACGKEVGNDA